MCSGSHRLKFPALDDVRRVITGHTSAGKSTIIADTVQPATTASPECVRKYDLHYTGESPAVIDTEVSQGKWVDEIADHPELTPSENGSIFRAVDFGPGAVSPFYRTVSLDYGVVTLGSVVLESEDGKRVTLNAGDTIVQRGTMHSWRNETTEWARVYFIALGAKPVHINGQALKEESKKGD